MSFTATVANDSSSKGVKWSLSGTGCMGAACGALSNQTATTATYIAPSPVAANVSVSVTATSAADSTKSTSDSVTVFPPPTVTTTLLQNATGGSAYNVTLQESGGIAPFTWSLASGSSLPAGLSIDSNGTISGTPTAGGLFNFTVQVADSGNPPFATTAKLSLTVVPVPATVSGAVAVGTAPSAIAVDPASNKIYVADFGSEGNDGICSTCYCPGVNGSLTVIDGATQSPTTTSFSYAYSNPLDLAVNPANRTLYVASRVFFTVSPTCGYSDNLGVLGESTLTQTATTPVGGAVFTARVAINEDTGHVYVADWRDGTVTVLDANGNVLDTINLPTRPTAVAVNTTTNKIYVATNECPTCFDPVSNNIIVIDGATNQVVTTITDPNAADPSSVAVNPISDTIYVTNGQSNNLTVIDGASDSVSATLSAGLSPSSVAVDPQTNLIYIANSGNHDFNQHGTVTVINGTTNATTTTLTDSNMPYPFRIAVNSTTNKIYVASILSNNVTVIDGAH